MIRLYFWENLSFVFSGARTYVSRTLLPEIQELFRSMAALTLEVKSAASGVAEIKEIFERGLSGMCIHAPNVRTLLDRADADLTFRLLLRLRSLNVPRDRRCTKGWSSRRHFVTKS